jgi:alpha-beta hydrolase superfamily lysophospholipase
MMAVKSSGFIMSLVILISLIGLFGVVMPWLGLKSASEPVTSPPIDAIAYEEVSFTRDGLTLSGWWLEAENPRATLLFVHGAGSSRVSPFFNTLGFYAQLQRAGISVFTFDQRNHGSSDYTDGYLRMGATEHLDLLSAREWLAQRTENDVPTIICGLSMGGATSIYALANGMLADGLLLFDPMLNTRDALERGGWVGYGLPPVFFRPMAYLAPLFWSLPYGKADALNVAKGLRLPIAIVQNREDPITRAQWSQQLAETSDWTSIEFVPKTAPNHDCLADKGRWGTHASSFHCHPDWTLNQVEHLLRRVNQPAA